MSIFLRLSLRKAAAEMVEVYLEKQNALNKDYFYPQYDPAELFQCFYKD